MARKKKIHHRHNRLSFGGKLAFVLLTILSAVILIPIVFTFLYSFFPQSEITAYLKGRGSYDTTKWLDVLYSPAMFSLRQYYKIFIEEPSYLKLFCNSMMYTGAILVGQALIVPLTAYCLSRFQFHGRDLLFFCILVLMILPFQVTMAPSVTVLRWLGIMETPWAVILPMCFSPFYIFLLRQFMVGIPNELLEAGAIDGAGNFRIFRQIVFPMAKNSWILDRLEASGVFNQISTDRADVAFAGSALYILPTLLIYLYFQEDIVAGIQLSELK